VAVTQSRSAIAIPVVVRKTPFGPWARAFLVTSAMSGPGVTARSREMAMKARKS